MQRSTMVKKFMKETGYTNGTVTHLGVQKFRKNSKRVWDYKNPEKMLNDFAKWMLDQDISNVS